MQLAVDKYTSVDILLRLSAKILVLRHDPFVYFIDGFKVLVTGVFVSVHLIRHNRLSGGLGDEALEKEEMRSDARDKVSVRLKWLKGVTYETFIEALGK